jgi:hypothetical protein
VSLPAACGRPSSFTRRRRCLPGRCHRPASQAPGPRRLLAGPCRPARRRGSPQVRLTSPISPRRRVCSDAVAGGALRGASATRARRGSRLRDRSSPLADGPPALDIATDASASSARKSGAVIAAAPNLAARPSTNHAAGKGRPMPANAGRPPVASRGGRSRGRILAAASIALVGGAVLVAVAPVVGPERRSCRTGRGAVRSRRDVTSLGVRRRTGRGVPCAQSARLST